jgi:signal transduction histidine kinase
MSDLDVVLQSLHETGRAIRFAHAPDVAAQTTLCHIRRLVPCVQAVVLAFDLEAAEAMVLAALPDGRAGAGGTRLPLDALDIADALRRGCPYVVEDTAASPQPPLFTRVFGPSGARSFMSVPLVAEDRLIGVIDVAADEPHVLERSHVLIASEVADQLAIALQHNQLLQQVRANSERLRALSHQLIATQENERRHIARELHDEIGQSLTAVKINLETMLRLPDKEAIGPPLDDSIAIVKRVLQQVRALSLDLRPAMLDDLGLESALRWYLRRQAERAGFATEFSADPIPAYLAPEVETICFRIVQEALTNVVRHARARHVRVALRWRDAMLQLVIADDGVGFDPREAQAGAAHDASLGLIGMQERVLLIDGELFVESASGCGTTVRAHVPLPPAPAQQS